MRLFEGITRTYGSQGEFYKALHRTISELNAQYPDNNPSFEDVRDQAALRSIPIGGHAFVDPIKAVIDAGRDSPNDAMAIVVAFQLAWEHYQTVCRAEGRMAA